ncbi:MAG: secondary thiamine-phosphate synthase enzyme YjbQ [Deferribacterales bacterium]
MLSTITIKTTTREEFIDITNEIIKTIKDLKINNGICCIYSPHTTSAITINEGADPSVKKDIVNTLKKLIPYSDEYTHLEGNSDSHIKTTLVGPSTTIIIDNGKPLLGTWQKIFFCEFDGPRTRKIYLKIITG